VKSTPEAGKDAERHTGGESAEEEKLRKKYKLKEN